ncbi:hypothetical protein CCMA1212_004780 [Trichoderma ghanense]|uniref:Uncharacterized protein n=1 Tax=Trichoderma ghanense TaxID=65468 RepID=A0ABY2H6F4_9HYPO
MSIEASASRFGVDRLESEADGLWFCCITRASGDEVRGLETHLAVRKAAEETWKLTGPLRALMLHLIAPHEGLELLLVSTIFKGPPR